MVAATACFIVVDILVLLLLLSLSGIISSDDHEISRTDHPENEALNESQHLESPSGTSNSSLNSTIKDYHEPGLDEHNKYRALHRNPPLVLDSKLNELADKCAIHYAEINAIDHSCPDKQDNGENIYKRGGVDLDAVAATKLGIKLWYEEIKDWNFETHGPKVEGNFKSIGHFTQLVWNSSEKLGMGHTAKRGTGIFVVALYDPAGNYKGEYKDNVFPLLLSNDSDYENSSEFSVSETSSVVPNASILSTKLTHRFTFTCVISLCIVKLLGRFV